MKKIIILSLLIGFASCDSLSKKEKDSDGHAQEIVSEAHRVAVGPSLIIDGARAGDTLFFSVDGVEVSPQFVVSEVYLHPTDRADIGCWSWTKSYEGTTEKDLAPKEVVSNLNIIIYDKTHLLSDVAKVERSEDKRLVFKVVLTEELLQGENYIEFTPRSFTNNEIVSLGFIGLKGGCKWHKYMRELGLFAKHNANFVSERRYRMTYRIVRTS